MGKLMDSIHRWNFDKKIKALLSAALILTALIVLIVSSISSAMVITEQSRTMLQQQNRAVAAGFENSLNNYKSLAYSLVMDSSVQNYFNDTKLVEDANNARNVLRSILNMYSSLNFIALVSPDETYLYKGKEALATTRFEQIYKQNYENCRYIIGTSLRMGFNKAYYDHYTLDIYFPIYDTNYIGINRGMLCMSFNNTSLDQVLAYQDNSMHSSVAVIDGEGVIVAASDQDKMGGKRDISLLLDENGNYSKNGRYYMYQRISNWPFYVVSSVEQKVLYASCFRTVILLLVLVAGAVAISLLVMNHIIRMLYRPMDKVVHKMDAVASGSLQTRINERHMGADFKKMAKGFNTMMDKIMELMEQVKEEQHQMEQIRFNALQSQIKPHFLYNTLECVHWQAEADGNKEISTLVKALARYYRICLSKGRDLVSLYEEIECVRSYIIIQNMRYGNIIDSSFSISPSFYDIQIPKLTLQPLVENSIYHGIKVKEGKRGCLALSVQCTDGEVRLTLADTGTGMTQEQVDEMNSGISEFDETFGYGVRNVHRRIQLQYGKRYGLHYARNVHGGVSVTIRLPEQRISG